MFSCILWSTSAAAYWFTHDARLDQAVATELLDWKRRTGGVLAALTNQERHRVAYLTGTLGLDRIFDHIVWSGDIGVTKSDTAFFTRALSRIGVATPPSLPFIDDDSGNVAAARAAGWPAVVFTGVNDLREVLAKSVNEQPS